MSGKIILSATQRKVLHFMVLGKNFMEQSEIVSNFDASYTSPDSARVAIGRILQQLHFYELIERVPTTDTTYKENVNVWKVSAKGKLY